MFFVLKVAFVQKTYTFVQDFAGRNVLCEISIKEYLLIITDLLFLTA